MVESKVEAISTRNTITYKICKLCKAIFSTHFNILEAKFGILPATYTFKLFRGISFFGHARLIIIL